MGQLAQAAAVLTAVKATVPAVHPVPADLANKQSDLETAQKLVTQVLAGPFTFVVGLRRVCILLCAGLIKRVQLL